MYQYHMVQVPPNIHAQSGNKGNEAASYLQNIANEKSAQGWEFYRVDTVGVVESPGCLAALLGAKQSVTDYFVITFRRPA